MNLNYLKATSSFGFQKVFACPDVALEEKGTATNKMQKQKKQQQQQKKKKLTENFINI